MSRAAAMRLADEIAAYLSSEAKNRPAEECLTTAVTGLKVVRDPSLHDLPTEHLTSVMRYWLELPKVDGVPNLVKIAPEDVRPALGYLILVDIDEEGDNFRYALYGSLIAEVSGFDMTGKSVWDLLSTSDIQVFFAACYMAARQLRCPIYTVHEAPPAITVSHWHRLILPLGLDGEIKRFLVCNIPMHDGEVR